MKKCEYYRQIVRSVLLHLATNALFTNQYARLWTFLALTCVVMKTLLLLQFHRQRVYPLFGFQYFSE